MPTVKRPRIHSEDLAWDSKSDQITVKLKRKPTLEETNNENVLPANLTYLLPNLTFCHFNLTIFIPKLTQYFVSITFLP
jgi:hypothetical protein